MTPPPAVALAQEPQVSDSHLLAQLLDRMGDVLSDVGSIKERLNQGQKNFDAMRAEHKDLREMISPIVTKITAWEPHVTEAQETTKKFKEIEPEFGKMKTVTARFLTVAMVQGSVVGAALTTITWIWPVVWEWVKAHISLKM